VRRASQLRDNLAAGEVEIPNDALARLDAVSAIELGFPHDFIRDTWHFVYGPHRIGKRGRNNSGTLSDT
jgi:hypothetical protein